MAMMAMATLVFSRGGRSRSTILHGSLSVLVAAIGMLIVGPVQQASATTLKTSVMGQQWSLGLTGGSDFQQALVAAQLHVPNINDGPLSVSAFMPFAWTSDDDANADLTGVGDAQLRGIWKSESSRWAFTAGVDLPTGKTPLSASEYIVATRIMASRVLDFYFKRPGEGLDFMVSAAHSIPIGRTTVLGFAAAGFLKGDYDVATNEEGVLIRTSPGNRIHLSASLLAREHNRNPDWDFRSSIALQIAGNATLSQGAESFDVEEGLQGSLDVAYGRRLGRSGRLGLFLYLLGREQMQVDGRDLLAVEILGIGTRWVVDVGTIYTWGISEVTDLSFGAAYTTYQLELADDVNSRVASFQVRATRTFLPRTVLSADLSFGFGSTPWSVADAVGTWERRDLRGWSFGLSTQFVW
jgi:hypothetical protein